MESPEETLPRFHVDTRGFWCEEERIFPTIADAWPRVAECNTARIVLPAGPSEDLRWETSKKEAEACIHAGKNLVWEFDWGSATTAMFYDSALFSSRCLALQEWGKTLGPHFQTHTLGIILYRGSVPTFGSDEGIQERYTVWLDGREHSDFHAKLYASQLFYEYMHRLGSFLPSWVPLLALLDATGYTNPAEQAVLFANDRAGHLHLGIKGALAPFSGLQWEYGLSNGGWIGEGVPVTLSESDCKLGVCIPTEDSINPQLLESIREILDHLTTAKKSYRLLPELSLNEQWDGIDQLLVLEKPLTTHGKRLLKGFIAAGGEVIFCDTTKGETKGWMSCIQ